MENNNTTRLLQQEATNTKNSDETKPRKNNA